jgi:integrase
MPWVERSGTRSWRVRFPKADGTLGSDSGFLTKRAASEHAADMEAQQRRGTFRDPIGGRTLFATWADRWIQAVDVDVRTEESYRSKLRNHLLPRWHNTPLMEFTNTAVVVWAKHLRERGMADVSVSDITKLLSLMLSDAVDEGLIAANPVRLRHRGRRRHTPRAREKMWATPEQVLRICDNATHCYGHAGAILILTAAYTGARWGELTGPQRHNLNLDAGWMRIDPDLGALKESNGGKLWLGPPKTIESARLIMLPPFLPPLLEAYLATHQHPHVFVTPDQHRHRRSNFSRRCMRPSADGCLNARNLDHRVEGVLRGLPFHGLRHSHKTWMIADAIPDVAQARRLGHTLPDGIDDIYSHVASEVEQRLIAGLQRRWESSQTALGGGELVASWRQGTRSGLL